MSVRSSEDRQQSRAHATARFSRRAALLGAAGIALSPVLMPTARASAADDEFEITLASEGRPLVFFDQSFARRRTWILPDSAQIRVTNADQVELEIGFDTRLAASSESLIATRNGRTAAVSASSEREATGLRVVTYALSPDQDGMVIADLTVPVVIDNLYPNDLVPSALGAYLKATALHTDGSTSTRTLDLGTVSASSDTIPAAVTVAASWDTVAAAESSELVYRAPTAIAVSNAGPGTAAYSVEILSDSRLSGEPTLTLEASGGRDGGDVEVRHDVDASGLRRTTATELQIAPSNRMLIHLAWPAITLPRNTAGAVASTVRVDVDPSSINRTPPGMLSGTDQSIAETLLPKVDVARAERG